MTPNAIADVLSGMNLSGEQPSPTRTYGTSEVVRYPLNYQVAGLHPSVDAAHKAIQWFINDIDHNQSHMKRWVSLLGASGCGKSHLARNAISILRQRGFSVAKTQFWSWRNAKTLASSKGNGMSFLQNLNILALDDIGSDYLSSDKAQAYSATVLLGLLDARVGKWTILTSNLSPYDIANNLDPRLASRLYRGQNEIVDMSQADDYCQNLYKRKHPELAMEGGAK